MIKSFYAFMLKVPEKVDIRYAFVLGLEVGNRHVFSGEMPCGRSYNYTAETFPLVSKKCDCGDDGHWIVKWQSEDK